MENLWHSLWGESWRARVLGRVQNIYPRDSGGRRDRKRKVLYRSSTKQIAPDRQEGDIVRQTDICERARVQFFIYIYIILYIMSAVAYTGGDGP